MRRQLSPTCLILFALDCLWTTTDAFIISRNNNQQYYYQWVNELAAKGRPSSIILRLQQGRPIGRFSKGSLLFAANAVESPPDLDSKDPFVVLGLEPSPSLDKKQIKRAYKRMALKYHPDVVVNKDATSQAKKLASDRFAKINWAYQTLMGKGEATTTSSSTSSTATSRTSSGWTPPHRRSTSSTSSATGGFASTDWRDYIPKYDDDDIADGDSFGAILSDLFSGAAKAVGGGSVGVAGAGASIFRDFVEFLEQNVDGYSSMGGGASDDATLRILLQTGSIQEVGDEMDDTQLVVQQLAAKLSSLQGEIMDVQAEGKIAARYLEKLELDERAAELEARKKVVEGYLSKARKRLLSLQSRYKELIVSGGNDERAGGSSSFRSYSPSSYTTTTSASNTAERTFHEQPEDKWKDESFGSFGRGRGSSRRRRSSSTGRFESTRVSPSSSSSTSPAAGAPRTRTGTPNPRSESYPPLASSYDPSIPPHRRASSSVKDDSQRLQELKVDEEFDRLKRELGL